MPNTFRCCFALLAIAVILSPASGWTASSRSSNDFKRVTVDIGGSSNFSNNEAAYEAHLGVNLYLLSWLSWRNAPFYRTQTGRESSYGLDSSIAGQQEIALGQDLTGHGRLGGGYRVTSESGASAPFVELALGGKLKGLGATLSAKRIFHRVNSTAGLPDETLFSFDIAGAASF